MSKRIRSRQQRIEVHVLARLCDDRAAVDRVTVARTALRLQEDLEEASVQRRGMRSIDSAVLQDLDGGFDFSQDLGSVCILCQFGSEELEEEDSGIR